jgi:pimeloyl-ACP methyl ester carboxylesterase
MSRSLLLGGAILGPVAILSAAACQVLPSMGANGLLRPARNRMAPVASRSGPAVTFQGGAGRLVGWWFPSVTARRATVIYLHGVADNRGSSLEAARRLTPRGFDVVAYDSRAHGDSEGDVCTYGFHEKRDLQRVLDGMPRGPVIVIGSSLGAAVALQAAAEDDRIRGVVAAEAFGDLRTIAIERAPKILTKRAIRKAFTIAEAEGRFVVDDVSPVRAAPLIKVPVLLLHGALDRETPPAHSQRIFDALAGPKRLVVVQGAGHNQSLQASTWREIDGWLETILRGDSN